MRYSEGADSWDVGPTGRCPESHPVVVPQVMYEVMWDVSILLSLCLAWNGENDVGFESGGWIE